MATNGGGYAEFMAEHALAMALAAVAVKHGAARLFAYWRRCIQPRDFSSPRKKWNDLIWLKYQRPWAGYELLQ